ncbi:hypothetical protein [Oceanospirillum beijerinckii]|uniref:hypothetical protein n=1 Tax=Oceanospirillum beijerinckii TaxID=64976 RepID=UPI000429A3FC|nr:hypothetical protein [Oceanospirillum beijerinckii]
MKKTDKKIEKNLITALTHVCDAALDRVEGFQWLTHIANFNKFPESLSVICIFDSIDNLEQAKASAEVEALYALIGRELKAANIAISDVARHVCFDTEEECTAEHDGKWSVRLRKH